MSTCQREDVSGDNLPSKEIDESTLMRRIAARDTHAYELLYYRYAPRLLKYLIRILSQRELAEEALHEVMLVLWKKSSQFNPHGCLAPWLFGIARREAFMVKRKVIRASVPLAASASGSEMASSPEEGVLHDERGLAVVAALSALPLVERKIVELTYYHEFSYREIAAIVGCAENTVKTRMARARRRLAQELSALGLDPTGRSCASHRVWRYSETISDSLP